MKDFPTKVNLSGGDDSGSAQDFGAKEFNSLSVENETAVTSTGQTLTTGQGDDTATDQLARALVMAGQSASSYTDSGVADAYILTSTLATLVQPAAYFNGMLVRFIPGNANTGTSTINVFALGAKAIRTVADANITAGVLLTTKIYDLVYISSYASAAGAFVVSDNRATATSMGESELATGTETIAGTDSERVTTPAGIQAKAASNAETEAGTLTTKFVTPASASAAANTSWTAMSLDNGWVATRARYRLIDNNTRVEIDFYELDGDNATSVDIFLLPSGHQPTYPHKFAGVSYSVAALGQISSSTFGTPTVSGLNEQIPLS